VAAVKLGAVVPTWAAFGVEPYAGNDFATRYDDDLALLAELGLSEVRIAFPWHLLQPAPGRVDDDVRELMAGVLTSAEAHGLSVWATLFDGVPPRWFVSEGGFSDERNAGTWWPRWVEWVAETFGDRVAGWCPLHDPVGHVEAAYRWGTTQSGTPDFDRHARALQSTIVAHRDAYRILQGSAPVATSLAVALIRPTDETAPAAREARYRDHLVWDLWLRALRDGVVAVPDRPERNVQDLAGACDLLGVALERDLGDDVLQTTDDDGRPIERIPVERVDEAMRRWEERVEAMLHRAAEEGPDVPLVVSSLRMRWQGDADRTRLIEAAGRALQRVIGDGIDVAAAFYEPAVDAAPGTPYVRDGLITRDREVNESAYAWTALSRS
jgi:beta-glucosidase